MPRRIGVTPDGEQVIDEASGVSISRAAYEQAQSEGRDPFAGVVSSAFHRLEGPDHAPVPQPAEPGLLDRARAAWNDFTGPDAPAAPPPPRPAPPTAPTAPAARPMRRGAPRPRPDVSIPPDLVDAGSEPMELPDEEASAPPDVVDPDLAVSEYVTKHATSEAPKPDVEGEALAWAQREAAKRSLMSDLGRSFSSAADLGSGLKTDKATWDALDARAGQPVLDARAKQKAALDYADKMYGRKKDEAAAARADREIGVREKDAEARRTEFGADNARADRQLAEQERHNRAGEAIAAAKRRGAGGQAKGTVVPGLKVAPGAAPTADDAKRVKAGAVSASKMRSSIARLADLHAKHGPTATGEVGTQMAQIYTAIKLEAKNIAELGALSGPDNELMKQLSGADPSTFAAVAKSYFGTDNTQAALQELGRWVADQENAINNAYGYQRSKGAPTAGGVKDARSAIPTASALPPDKAARLAELRRKRDEGALR